MAYREEVQRECDTLGISNPIQEKDLTVAAVSFRNDGVWVRIEGTEMNRAGRLFFQAIYGGMNYSPTCVRETKRYVIQAAEQYFSENWLDAEKVGRKMLIAFKRSTGFEVHWK